LGQADAIELEEEAQAPPGDLERILADARVRLSLENKASEYADTRGQEQQLVEEINRRGALTRQRLAAKRRILVIFVARPPPAATTPKPARKEDG
jgi:hypothetical protein